MFGRFGQVVEKKKSISLQDISAVRPADLLVMPFCFVLSFLSFDFIS